MPLIRLTTSAETPSTERAAALLKTLSKRLAEHVAKPERYVMTCWSPRAQMTLGGSDSPSCYVEISNIGTLTSEQTRAMSAEFTRLLSETLHVAADRIYIGFHDAKPHLWGWNGDTFE